MRLMMQELEDARMSRLLADSRAQAEARQEEGTGLDAAHEASDGIGGAQNRCSKVAHRCNTHTHTHTHTHTSNICAPCTFVLSESKHRTSAGPAPPASIADQSGCQAPVTPPQQQGSMTQAPGGSLLWVNKYAPQSFMSLLSDEQTNRAVAKWVKSWDPCLGKTTLAHVVARHCGYQPHEINASDDRTATALTQRVTDAVQMKPVLGSRKPNLVVIDEIDGATGGAEGHSAIAALVKIITAGSKQQPEGNDGGKPESKQRAKSGKKGKGLPPLARPLICIANDLYAPALRPLREVAQIFQFKEPNVEKLVSRLQHICNLEHVRVDKSALYALVQRAGVDIRSCLNTLQLLAKQAAQHQHPGRGAASRPAPHIKAKQVLSCSCSAFFVLLRCLLLD
ncbi:P-loop containing nucleoside triphosphate hydrolase protein [Dunaliella salina]|uniref:P-loop containing nucleoside triphosphate hydrolase protein n=1 Tax=Dunaliella salina TaxID=3046 RepID=A0ABQ7GY80_DUNSA|nr:P-loop containing nucleoside triphosphate hydrolase protein [Dunaliella salina]KAF5839560.1 P-loop containing nucleoside triphosphate hydrolase protein [Dunaliella salina]|eukprot:KAF5839559.1 P-loop containing nucleoside triphosphate hydrolase protein [Dunaliella salina]